MVQTEEDEQVREEIEEKGSLAKTKVQSVLMIGGSEDSSEDSIDVGNKKRRGREASPEEKEGGIYIHLRRVFYPARGN